MIPLSFGRELQYQNWKRQIFRHSLCIEINVRFRNTWNPLKLMWFSYEWLNISIPCQMPKPIVLTLPSPNPPAQPPKPTKFSSEPISSPSLCAAWPGHSTKSPSLLLERTWCIHQAGAWQRLPPACWGRPSQSGRAVLGERGHSKLSAFETSAGGTEDGVADLPRASLHYRHSLVSLGPVSQLPVVLLRPFLCTFPNLK